MVLAVPAPVAADLLPGLSVPDAFEAILNLHFRREADPGPAGFVGLVGGTAEWVFVKPGIVSVTISAANRLVDLPAATLAERVWPEVRAAPSASAGPDAAMARGEGEARHLRRHPGAGCAPARAPAPRSRNLALAGDWTATGLPATIEGAIRSGRNAAALLQSVALAA